MTIPNNISRDHIIRAIEKIDIEGIQGEIDSLYYDLVYNGIKYPPNLVVSYANFFANGKELDRSIFSEGINTPGFELLKSLGFKIEAKDINYFVLGATWVEDGKSNDQTIRFIKMGIWENGYEDKFLDLVKSVKIGDVVAIKSSFATNSKSMLRIKAIGKVIENIGDGKTLKVKWTKNLKEYDLEGYGGYRSTIQKVNNKDIEAIFKLNNNSNYYSELKKFIHQASTTNLKTSEYLKKFQNLIVKVSFGQGNSARVPWIAFLGEEDSVQEGIYPVYLYYKDKDLLILSYGISETRNSQRVWQLNDELTIEKYFFENKLGRPERYGSSFIYKVYKVASITEDIINDDLNNLISIYKQTYNKIVPNLNQKSNSLGDSFYSSLLDAGLQFNKTLSTQFVASLITKPFIILTGLSGSGKTKLAQSFVQWICQDVSQYKLIPVGADWTNREPLLGYPNALKPDEYVKPDSGVLDLIIQANNQPDLPYFLILDEMNLSHVERYFADFLSVMESNEKIPLYAEGTVQNRVPAKLNVPSNLFIIGTVNIDETTNMFSPKVLDRANTIEFRVTLDEMKNFLNNIKEIKMEALKGKGAGMAKSFLEMANSKEFDGGDLSEINAALVQFFDELKKNGAEFGYRSATEILRLINNLSTLDKTLTTYQKIDIAIMQKLLPKLHGSRRKLCPTLETLGSFCISGDIKIVKDIFEKPGFDFNGVNVLYPLSLEKIARMYRGAIDNGFASFAEA